MNRISSIYYSISLGVLFFAGCGATDYGDEEILDWRENALKAKSKEPEISIGALSISSNLEQFPGISHSDACPENTLCLKAPYFGEEQLSHLNLSHPDILTLKAGQNLRRYTTNKSISVLIESDLFILNEGAALETCGSHLSVITSEASGSGIIDTSGCNKSSAHGGAISFVAGKVESLKFISNGHDGHDGKDGAITWKPAKNGDPHAFKIDVAYEKEPIKLCIDPFSCLNEALPHVPKSGSDEQYRDAVRNRAADIARLNLEFLQKMGAPRSQIEQFTTEAAGSLKDMGDLLVVYLGDGGCFFTSDPRKQNGETGFVKTMTPKVSGVEALSGEDAEFRSDGENGEEGGNAGKIQIVAKEIKISNPEAKPGRMGRAGKSFIQEAGKGATPAETSKEVSYRVFARVSCELGPDSPHMKQYFLRDLDFEVKKIFRVGEAYSLNREDHLSQKIGEPYFSTSGTLQGRDGKELLEKITKSGAEGAPSEPSVIKAAVNDLVVSKVRETCPKCAMPKVLGSTEAKKD